MAKKTEDGITLSFWCDDSTRQRIDSIAEKDRRSRSNVILMLVDEALMRRRRGNRRTSQ